MGMQGVKEQDKTGRCKSYALMLRKVGDIFFSVPSLPPKHKLNLLCRCNLFKNGCILSEGGEHTKPFSQTILK